MSRSSVVGTRSSLLWLLILVVVVVLIGAAVGALVLLPQMQASRTEQARLAEVERHYQAGVAFQSVDDWASAEGEYRQVIVLDPSHKDATQRLNEARGRLSATQATVTASAVAGAARATAEAQAAAEAAPMATAAALEARYQRGLGLMNLKRWEEAKAELEMVFSVDANYRDIQAKLAMVSDELTRLIPTATATSLISPTPMATTPAPSTPTPMALACRYEEEISIVGASASSVWDERYLPEKAIDGDLNTGWWAGHGKGKGEWLDLQLPFEAILVQVDVLNGYPPYWNGNPRLKAVTIVLSDGSAQQLTFYDNVKVLQPKKLVPVRSSRLRIIVDDVYKSDHFEAPGMNEIKVFGCRE